MTALLSVAVLGLAAMALLSPAECPPDLDCHDVTIRLDTDGPDRTYRVAWREGIASENVPLLVLGGGPGISGVEQATATIDALPQEIVQQFTLIFVDQLGVGGSEPLSCEIATRTFASAHARLGKSGTSEEWRRLGREYADACFNESSVEKGGRARYATAQFVSDLEAIRQELAFGSWHIMAQSYGTLVAQSYAAKYPANTRSLILDAPIDPHLAPGSLAVARSVAAEQALAAVFTVCAADTTCAGDFQDGLPALAYARLAERLRSAPLEVVVAAPDDARMDLSLTVADLGRVAYASLANSFTRMSFLRLLAAADGGDLAPLARAADLAVGLDPATGELWPDAEGFADAPYYAVTCADWATSPSKSTLAEVVDSDEETLVDPVARAPLLRDAVCLGWDIGKVPEALPSGAIPLSVPTLVISATQDPVAPHALAEAIARRSPHVSMVTVTDGGHVSTGRGDLVSHLVLIARRG